MNCLPFANTLSPSTLSVKLDLMQGNFPPILQFLRRFGVMQTELRFSLSSLKFKQRNKNKKKVGRLELRPDSSHLSRPAHNTDNLLKRRKQKYFGGKI